MRRPHGVIGRLLRRVVLAGGIAALILTSALLYLEYHRDLDVLMDRLAQVESGTLPSITENVWLEDRERLELVFKGLLQLPGIAQVELLDGQGRMLVRLGQEPAHAIVRTFPLKRLYNGQIMDLGQLRVSATTARLHQRMVQRLWGILAVNLALIMVLSAVIYALTHQSVIRPLRLIAHYAEELGRQGPTETPEQDLGHFHSGDEMWELVRTLNLMRQELARGHQELAANEHRLRILFSASPVSLWEEDFSAVAAALEKHRPDIDDIDAWMRANPTEVLALADLVRVIDVNDATISMHHARNREELLHRLPLIFTPDSLPAFQAQLRALWTGETALTTDTVVRTLDGELRHVLLRWKVATGHEQTLNRVIVSQEDITERKAWANQLEDALARLRESNAELERVTFVTAHDLLEPMRAVISFSQLIERHVRASGTPSAELSDDLSYLQAAALRMKLQIEGMNRYASICQEQVVMHLMPLSLAVNDALHKLSLPDDSEIEIGHLPEIIGSRRQLAELFFQIIENSIKFRTVEKLHICIAAQPTPGGWRVTVSDNGIGIDPAFSQLLFDLFRRLHGPGQYSGVGIGLALCRKIMERHDGHIAFDPGYYPGARLVLTFPAAPLATPLASPGATL
ncbi:MAG: Signal transduction histidine [Rhodospirillaceae bacterium]|nr:MAG: Signal transduction histidine [Rhodospirillaceae bacterium]TNC97708.1 MAG: Signal transduction histidine kinase [Stygiobacter sp.]